MGNSKLMKYLIASILVLVVLQYQFEILYLDSILWHLFNYIQYYILFLFIIVLFQIIRNKLNSVSTETIQTELSKKVSQNSLIQTNNFFTLMTKTDFNDDESFRKLRDELLIIISERNLMYSLVSSNRNINAMFESVRIKVISFLKSYKIEIKEAENEKN